MIASRRILHPFLWIGVGIAATAVFFEGITRRPNYFSSKLPIEISSGEKNNTHYQEEVASFEIEGNIHSVFLVQKGRLSVKSSAPLIAADPLLYWTKETKLLDNLPSSAFFIGPITGDHEVLLPLPESYERGKGNFLIYSLAKNSIIAQAGHF